MRLSRESALELRKFLSSVEIFLARYADSDPEAKRLYRELSAAESGGASSRMIYLSADDANHVASDLDVGGHYVTRYDGGPENCLRCTAALLAATPTATHTPTQTPRFGWPPPATFTRGPTRTPRP